MISGGWGRPNRRPLSRQPTLEEEKKMSLANQIDLIWSDHRVVESSCPLLASNDDHIGGQPPFFIFFINIYFGATRSGHHIVGAAGSGRPPGRILFLFFSQYSPKKNCIEWLKGKWHLTFPSLLGKQHHVLSSASLANASCLPLISCLYISLDYCICPLHSLACQTSPKESSCIALVLLSFWVMLAYVNFA